MLMSDHADAEAAVPLNVHIMEVRSEEAADSELI